jgi:GAF domain-containing protein
MTAAFGLPEGERHARFRPGAGLAGLVLKTNHPVVCERYGSLPEPAWPELAEHAVVGVPISWGGRLIGFFGIGSPPPRRFDQEDAETLALFARHAAIAIENARRYAGQQGKSERLATLARIGQIISASLGMDELLQRAADAIHELLGYSRIAIPLLDADNETLLIKTLGGRYGDDTPKEFRLPVVDGIMGAAVREKRPQLVNDVGLDPRYYPTPGADDVKAKLAVPILLGEQVLGVLNVESGGAFTEDDALSLQIVADHLGIAIRNARLYEREQGRARRLTLIARMGRIITAGLELDELLGRTADAIHDILGPRSRGLAGIEREKGAGGLERRTLGKDRREALRDGLWRDRGDERYHRAGGRARADGRRRRRQPRVTRPAGTRPGFRPYPGLSTIDTEAPKGVYDLISSPGLPQEDDDRRESFCLGRTPVGRRPLFAARRQPSGRGSPPDEGIKGGWTCPYPRSSWPGWRSPFSCP